MKILIVADVHGRIDVLSEFVDSISNKKFDLIIFPGDFTEQSDIPEGFKQTDIAEIILQKLKSLNIPLLCVPGNHDPFEIVDILEDYDANLHNSIKKIGSYSFIGFGGAATPFNTKFEPNDKEIATNLLSLRNKITGNFILVTHNPPKGTKLDMTESGNHVGSDAVRKFIEDKQPLLALSAHIHESGGIDRIKESTLFYPGALYERNYGIVVINKKHINCEIKRF